MNELANIIKQFLWEYAVNQDDFADHNSIIYSQSNNLPSGNYIVYYFNNPQYITQKPTTEIYDDKKVITEYKSCNLSISYYGKNAMDKLDDIATKLRFNSTAREFLEKKSINSVFVNLFDISQIINDNTVIESATLEVKLFYKKLTELEVDYLIDRVAINVDI